MEQQATSGPHSYRWDVPGRVGALVLRQGRRHRSVRTHSRLGRLRRHHHELDTFKDKETEFNEDISDWDTSSVVNMARMFQGAKAFNQPIGGWDTSSATNMNAMFGRAITFDQDISNWDLRSVQDLGRMFDDAHGLSDLNRRLIHANFSKNATWSYNWSTSTGVRLSNASILED